MILAPGEHTRSVFVRSGAECDGLLTPVMVVIVLLLALGAGPSAAVARPPALVALGDSLAMPEGGDVDGACTRPAALQGLNDLFACAAGGPVRFADTQPAFVGRGMELTNIAFGDPHFNQAGAQAAGLAIVHALRPGGSEVQQRSGGEP